MNFANLLQLLVSGLAMGAIYALIALGLYITHLVTTRVNFGQGDFMIVAAYLALACKRGDIPLPLAILVVLCALATLGWLLERVTIRPLDRGLKSPVGAYAWILTTAAFALILQNLLELAFGKSTQYSAPLFGDGADVIRVAGAGIVIGDLLVIVCAAAFSAAFCWLMFWSRWGRNVRAVAFNPEAAQLLGINALRAKTSAFVIASVLAGASGVLVGPLVTVSPQLGLIFTIKALVVAAIGGFSNPAGILIGGALFGVLEAMSNYYDSSFGDLYPLLAALLVVAVRPSGLFGEKVADVR